VEQTGAGSFITSPITRFSRPAKHDDDPPPPANDDHLFIVVSVFVFGTSAKYRYLFPTTTSWDVIPSSDLLPVRKLNIPIVMNYYHIKFYM
jgi:hypothetical protein